MELMGVSSLQRCLVAAMNSALMGIKAFTIMILIILPWSAVSGSDVLLKLRVLDLNPEASAVLLFIARSESTFEVVVEQAK